jgi:hypothetical protein
MRRALQCLGVSFLFVGCMPREFNSRSSQSDAGIQRNTSASAVRDVPATHCEIWVDKIRVAKGSHGIIKVNPFLKIDASKLDGAVTNVAFYERHSQTGASAYDSEWSTVAMRKFLGASNYFEIDNNNQGLVVVSDYSSTAYEGAFYVETDKGTRYWAKAEGDKNFQFNHGNMTPFADSCWNASNCADMNAIKTTAELNRKDINPNLCR